MTKLTETKESLERMQRFDPDSLARESDLGARFSLAAAVEPAKKLIRLYNQLGTSALDDFPDDILDQIKKQADADYNRFKSLLDFAPDEQQSPAQTRDQLVSQIEGAYRAAFQSLYMPIAYGASKSIDFQRMENDARASLQAVTDQASEITGQLSEQQEQAEQVLRDVRKVAAEQGVSQQAIYFKDEAKDHNELADTWRKYTVRLAIGVGIYAVATLFMHKMPFFYPDTAYDSLQLVASKILIFFVLTYMLLLAAKNFLNHKHNEIINKHRQNALMTFQALVDAAKGEESRDIVLTHAASCIFTPQDTGYTKNQSSSSSPSVMEMLPKTVLRVDK
ncbi:hypothetical protein [Lysobacter sp. F60174L2]|uniref:hypothetical protein n=1 Tax=Lysobacter sp. F60174L2 TaxID=3459295 RepID=UPI00403D83BC